MPLRPFTIALSSCPLHGASSPLPTITSSFSSRPQPCQTSQPRRRRYATVNHNQRPESVPGIHDVPHWPKSKNPTPYEIFDIPKGEPYTKKRFYQLVKLYHPDKHHHDSTSTSSTSASASTPRSQAPQAVPHGTRLERYRLVVAANDLLSSPSARHLYDTHGLGWNGDGRAPTMQETMRAADRTWRDRDGNASGNATWEDWERWHDSRSDEGPRRRAPLIMPNSTFAALVVMMCMVGALAQRTRAESMGDKYVEWKAQSNSAIGEEMRRRTSTVAGSTPQERVDVFLRNRENVAYEYVPNKYDSPPRQERPP